LSTITSGSLSVRRLDEVLGIPKLKYGGVRIKIDELENKEIIIKDAHEVPDTKFGSNQNYLRMEIDLTEDGMLKPATVNSSSKDVMEKVKLAKSQGALPVKAILRKVVKKNGKGYYWILE
jgi:hypothetical protein